MERAMFVLPATQKEILELGTPLTSLHQSWHVMIGNWSSIAVLGGHLSYELRIN